MICQFLGPARVHPCERTRDRRAADTTLDSNLVMRPLIPVNSLNDLSLADWQPCDEGTNCSRPHILDAGKPRISAVVGIAVQQITLVANISVGTLRQRHEPNALTAVRVPAATLDVGVHLSEHRPAHEVVRVGRELRPAPRLEVLEGLEQRQPPRRLQISRRQVEGVDASSERCEKRYRGS